MQSAGTYFPWYMSSWIYSASWQRRPQYVISCDWQHNYRISSRQQLRGSQGHVISDCAVGWEWRTAGQYCCWWRIHYGAATEGTEEEHQRAEYDATYVLLRGMDIWFRLDSSTNSNTDDAKIGHVYRTINWSEWDINISTSVLLWT